MLSTFDTAASALTERDFGPGFAPGFGLLFLLIPLFWIGVIALIITLVRRRWRHDGWGPGGHPIGIARTAEGSLAERFAQGDIDEKEYRARLEVLRAAAAVPRKR